MRQSPDTQKHTPRKDFSHLRHWITGEGYPKDCPSPPVILECVPSRSGLSMTVYDRGERIFMVQGCGFDRIGAALGEFLERLFQPELFDLSRRILRRESQERKLIVPVNVILEERNQFTGLHFPSEVDASWEPDYIVSLDGATGFESMQSIASAINLKVTRSESKAGTLIIIEKGN